MSGGKLGIYRLHKADVHIQRAKDHSTTTHGHEGANTQSEIDIEIPERQLQKNSSTPVILV